MRIVTSKELHLIKGILLKNSVGPVGNGGYFLKCAYFYDALILQCEDFSIIVPYTYL